MFYLNSRYYHPALRRFLTIDDVDYLEKEKTLGLNLFIYCNNDSINMSDSNGNLPKWLKTVIDISITALAVVAAVVVTVAVTKFVAPIFGPKMAIFLGTLAGTAVFGAINNTVNALYYNYISDGKSDLTSSSYVNEGYINRFDRLDYVKQQTKEEKFNITSWKYYSEYNAHMYGWFVSSWLLNNGVTAFSDIAESTKEANVDVGQDDPRFIVRAATLLIGLLGL